MLAYISSEGGRYFTKYIPLDAGEAKKREAAYEDTEKGCFMFYFHHMGKKCCVDATEETGHLGRLLNHSVQKANCVTKERVLGYTPRILLFADRDIFRGEELLYNYGERRPNVVKSNPWHSKKSEIVEETVFVSVNFEFVSENMDRDGMTDTLG